MDSDEEFVSFSDTENQSSPVPQKQFKRLKKADNAAKFSTNPLLHPMNNNSSSSSPSIHQENSLNFEALDTAQQSGEDLCEPDTRSGSGNLENFGKRNDFDSGFEGLDVEKSEPGVKRTLEFDSMDREFHGNGEDRMKDEIGDFRNKEELEKNLADLNGLKEKKEKKRKKRAKKSGDVDGYGDEPFSVGNSKRRENKERRESLKELRVESQRLLRETNEASFKPVRLVQKPVSSVLEKIRQRKQEYSKKLDSVTRSSLDDTDDAVSREVILDCDTENDNMEDIEIHKVARVGCEPTVCPFDVEDGLGFPSTKLSKDTANHSPRTTASQMDVNADSEQNFRAPVDDTQDLTSDSQTSESKDERSDDLPDSPLEEALAPSLIAMKLKLDSAPPDDFSSDEEDNDKENIDPHQQGSIDLTVSPKGDPMKAFVDEEAEEEDDSDNDLGRFKDDEEDEDDLDSEEVNDIIATGYQEKPIDNEMRNQLHQKWLEQQDASGTENLLQKLKYGSKQKETTLLAEKEDEEGEANENSEDEFPDDAEEITRSVVRMNLKKAKEMIPQMFTDEDDLYVSSDDEETQKALVRQNLSYKALVMKREEQAAFLAPSEAEGSKEIFGLIKKLNGVPDARKKDKRTSYFHMLSIGGNKTMSKSSFLGRGSKNSLSSSRKHGSSTIRSFVFERDESNSRNGISLSEDSSDLVQRENRPKKTVSAKFSSSETRSRTQNTRNASEMNSGPSLHEILRCPSLQSSHRNIDSLAGKVDEIYAAFKLDQNVIKKEPRVSISTV